MKIRSVLFDLDGTLVDSLDDLAEAVNHVRGEFKLPPLTSSDVCTMIGKGALNLVQRALPNNSASEIDRALQLFLDYNARHIVDKSRLYPGVTEMLKFLQTKGVRLAVISNKNEAHSKLILKSLGIHDCFESICGGDTFAESKPSPLPLLSVIGQQGVAPHECIMVGDSINDIQAGNLAGMATIGCSWGYGTSQELNQSVYIADSCDDLISAIMAWEPSA